MKNMKILICAGDPSGDLHASNLVRAIKQKNKDIEIIAIGGEKLAAVSDKFLFNLVNLQVHGFFAPLRQYFNLKKVLTGIINPLLKSSPPDIVIPVDYYGFNIELAKLSKSFNIPVYYFISPQVWASRKNRIKKIKKYVGHMMVIFPFEKEIYEKAGIPVTFIGHPMLDIIPEAPGQPAVEKKNADFKIGIYPGSRKQVISWNLPVMEKTAGLIKQQLPNAKFFVAGMSIQKGNYNTKLDVMYDPNYSFRRQLDLAITVSGTVTLENALLGTPMIVVYRLPVLMYHLIKSMVLISQICIVNFIAGKSTVPEFIQKDAQPEKIAQVAVIWLKNRAILNEKKNLYNKLRGLLGGSGATGKAADLIINKLEKQG